MSSTTARMCTECKALYRHFAMCSRGPGPVRATDTAQPTRPGPQPNTPEPPPVPNATPAIWPLVERDLASRWDTRDTDLHADIVQDMRDRDAMGRAKYGVPLQAFNQRNPLVDLYQEQLDSAVYALACLQELAPGAEHDGIQMLYLSTLDNLFLLRRFINHAAQGTLVRLPSPVPEVQQ